MVYVKLKDLKVGDCVRILGYESNQNSYRHKLLAMGLVPGTQLELIRIAPLGDPFEFRVRGFSLCIRRNEAVILRLEKIKL